MKLGELLSDILRKHIFGDLLHVFTLLNFKNVVSSSSARLVIFADECIPHDSSDYNKIVSPELLDPEEDPILFGIIRRCMIHGPCGLLKSSAPCMHNGSCSKPGVISGGATAPQVAFGEPRGALGEYLHLNY